MGAAAWSDDGSFTLSSRPAEGDVEDQYFQTVPQGLDAADGKKAPRLGALLAGPKGKQVQACARKCVPTCIRGGQGAPGLGPMSVRKDIVVFKDGYRSRNYCLTECITVCALSLDPAPAPGAAEGGGGGSDSSSGP